MADKSATTTTYHTDGLPKEDLFGRQVFAERVANTILQRPLGEEALVISITGDWGSGKTTALDYIKGQLSSKPCKIASFNPWRFHGEDMLLLELFQALVEAIDPYASVLTAWQKVGQWVEQQRNTIKIGGMFGNVNAPGAGPIFDASAAILSNWLRPRIEEVRKQAKEHLLKEGWRVVVFIDDVDRLEPTDLLTLLRIIKLTADLPNTTFILAMDEGHVSRIIGEHVKGGASVGRDYLEKIVQVRLALPTIPPHIVKDYTLGLIASVHDSHQVALSKNDLFRFQQVFYPLFAPLIKTPRMAKTLANAIHFEIGLLPAEVNTTDLMLLVTSRLFHPRLYEAIRDGASSHLFSDKRPYSLYEREEERPELRLAKFMEIVDEQDPHAKQALTEALKVWFPQFSSIESWLSGSDEWARERRLCSESYFWRYFASAIVGDDVPDACVREWIESNDAILSGEVEAKLKAHLNHQCGRAFVGKLQVMLPSRKEHSRSALRAIARVSSQLSRDGEDDIRGSIWGGAVRVAAECIPAIEGG